MEQSHLNILPYDVLLQIFVHLHPKEAYGIFYSCKDWNEAYDSDLNWKTQYTMTYEHNSVTQETPDWKRLFLAKFNFGLNPQQCSDYVTITENGRVANTHHNLQPIIFKGDVDEYNCHFVIRKKEKTRKGCCGIGLISKDLIMDIQWNSRNPTKYIGTYTDDDFQLGFFDNGYLVYHDKGKRGNRFKNWVTNGRSLHAEKLEWKIDDEIHMHVTKDKVTFYYNGFIVPWNQTVKFDLEKVCAIINIEGEVVVSDEFTPMMNESNLSDLTVFNERYLTPDGRPIYHDIFPQLLQTLQK